MTEIVIHFEVPEAAVPSFAPIVLQLLYTLAPAVQQCGGTGQVLLDGDPIEES